MHTQSCPNQLLMIPNLDSIQALQTLESPLHRIFGRQSVKLQTVGGGMVGEMDLKGQGGGKSESQWLAPMIESERVPDLFSQVHEGVDLRRVVWKPIAQRAWRRVFRVGVALGVIVAVPLALLIDPFALALIGPVALAAYVHARLYVRYSAYSLAPWGLVCKSGWFNRTLKLVRYGKIQAVSTAASPFDRRNGMAAVQIDTAGPRYWATRSKSRTSMRRSPTILPGCYTKSRAAGHSAGSGTSRPCWAPWNNPSRSDDVFQVRDAACDPVARARAPRRECHGARSCLRDTRTRRAVHRYAGTASSRYRGPCTPLDP